MTGLRPRPMQTKQVETLEFGWWKLTFSYFLSHMMLSNLSNRCSFDELTPPECFADYVRLRKNMQGGWRTLFCSLFSYVSPSPPPVPGAMNLSRLLRLAAEDHQTPKLSPMMIYHSSPLLIIKHYAPFRCVQNPMGINHKGRGGWDVTENQEKKICDAVFRWEDSHSVTKQVLYHLCGQNYLSQKGCLDSLLHWHLHMSATVMVCWFFVMIFNPWK